MFIVAWQHLFKSALILGRKDESWLVIGRNVAVYQFIALRYEHWILVKDTFVDKPGAFAHQLHDLFVTEVALRFACYEPLRPLPSRLAAQNHPVPR